MCVRGAAEMNSDLCDLQTPFDRAGNTDVTILCHMVMARVNEVLGRAQSARDTSWQTEQGKFLYSYKTKTWTAGPGPVTARWAPKPGQYATVCSFCLRAGGHLLSILKISDEKRWMN